MMMGVIRFINSTYHERRIKKDANPPPDDIKLDSGLCTALKHNMDATCRELHQKGKGVVQQQQTFSPEEFKKLIDYLSSMPQTGYKHLLVGYLALALQFGGRVSDYPKFKRRYVQNLSAICKLSCKDPWHVAAAVLSASCRARQLLAASLSAVLQGLCCSGYYVTDNRILRGL